MTRSNAVKPTASGTSLDIFGETTMHAVDSTRNKKNGKEYMTCQVRGKDILAKPEAQERLTEALDTLTEEDTTHGTETDREPPRPPERERHDR
jgi:hypothetical protein